jgi:hypothetical protein
VSERMTTIRLPSGKDGGFMDYGDKPADEMVAAYRQIAADMKERAEEILAAADSDFRIEVVRGVHVQHPVRLIQKGRDHTADCRCVRCVSARSRAA